eukprot:TRINITY_DN3221_c0_g1_i4.p1 TRINITY_DN3221_c0_g1~~TRINITY_DN3221_c0_g1_i4.p1  ORF type:complete len:534 (+),score=130.98 TRINITY_DN3221_c0_g1_i4:16-1617(+)
MERDIVQRAVAGVKYLVGLQLVSRVLTFVLNVLIVRHVDKEVFGAYSVQQQLLLSLVLFLSREGLRRACQRVGEAGTGVEGAERRRHATEQIVQLAWLCIPCSVVIVPVVCGMFTLRASPEEARIPGYAASMYICAAGAVVELLSEPLYCVSQYFQLYRARMLVEAAAVLLRCAASYVLAIHFQLGLLAFAWAQVVYGATLIVGYTVYLTFSFPGFSVSVLVPFQAGRRVDGRLLRFALAYTWQSLQKVVLTEGDKIVLWRIESLVSQGVYSVVFNLGSLAARFVFQPVEEVCFTAFARLAGAAAAGTDAVFTAHRILRLTLRLMLLIGLLFVTFGPNYSRALIWLLYTTKYSETAAPTVLAWYCLFVLLMAINGITEAFVHSVAGGAQLRRLNIELLACGAAYMAASLLCVRTLGGGTTGLVWANCVNMLLRIALSYRFIDAHFKRSGVAVGFPASGVLPHAVVLAAFATCFAATAVSERLLYSDAPKWLVAHCAVGACCGLVALAVVFLYEKSLYTEFRTVISRDHEHQHQ